MMGGWFRWYEGSCEDTKFRIVAHNCDVTVATVLGVWATLLEDASHAEHRGICVRSDDYRYTVTDLHEAELGRIIDAMCNVGLLFMESNGYLAITNWRKRQFESDQKDPTAAERMRRYRKRKATAKTVTGINGVTPQLLPDSDTDSDTDSEKKRARGALSAPWCEADRALFWSTFPNKVGKAAAMKAFDKASRRTTPDEMFPALDRYVAKTDDRPWCNPATWLNQDRWLDQSARQPARGLTDNQRKTREILDALGRSAENGKDGGAANHRLLPDDSGE